jgi:DNA-binding CsgD family transcriptional regulator
LRQPRKERVGLEALSQREFELLRVLGAGMSLKECAKHLNISTSSASTYRARLMEKLKLNTTAEIIRFALENDIVG